MRNTLLFIVVFTSINLFTLSIFGRQITNNEAFYAVNNKLIKLKKATEYTVNYGNEIKINNKIIAYAFDLIPQGYIIVTANTDLPPILAYSFESNFGELNHSNPLFSIITADINKRNIFNVKSDNSHILKNNKSWDELLNENLKLLPDTIFQQWPEIGNGWLKTNWTQNAPYYNFCPMDPVTGTRSIAGCPSVAMAQILNFHETTNNTQFDNSDDYYHNYAGRQYWIDNDYVARGFPSFPDLNAYLDTLNNHYANTVTLTNNDKAALTFACGVAARQVYTSGGSGTFGVDQAMEAYQKFSCTTAELLDTTDLDLFDRLSQNMKDALPAHLAIVDPSWSSGHNVVVDGYNTDDYYHLNFGWGGSYNGWYLLPEEIPYSLTVIEGVIVDILKSTTNVTNNVDNKDDFSVYPNPATNCSFTINYSSRSFEEISIRILNIQGTEVYNKEISKTTESIEIPLNSVKFVKGYYVIELIVGNKVNRKPLIVQ